MIEILRDQRQSTKGIKVKRHDIFTTKYEERETFENGKKIIEFIPRRTNLTKKIQETGKLIKANAAQQKMNEIEDAFKLQMENLKKELKK